MDCVVMHSKPNHGTSQFPIVTVRSHLLEENPDGDANLVWILKQQQLGCRPPFATSRTGMTRSLRLLAQTTAQMGNGWILLPVLQVSIHLEFSQFSIHVIARQAQLAHSTFSVQL